MRVLDGGIAIGETHALVFIVQMTVVLAKAARCVALVWSKLPFEERGTV